MIQDIILPLRVAVKHALGLDELGLHPQLVELFVCVRRLYGVDSGVCEGFDEDCGREGGSDEVVERGGSGVGWARLFKETRDEAWMGRELGRR